MSHGLSVLLKLRSRERLVEQWDYLLHVALAGYFRPHTVSLWGCPVAKSGAYDLSNAVLLRIGGFENRINTDLFATRLRECVQGFGVDVEQVVWSPAEEVEWRAENDRIARTLQMIPGLESDPY